VSEYVLGVDIGTASSKGVICRLDGTSVAKAAVPHAMQLSRPGWAEMDADAVWWGDVVALCRQLTTQVDPSLIGGVCISGVGPCFLPCDGDGQPLRHGILYGIDTRATDEIRELTDRYGADEILRRGGTALSTQAIGPKMLWTPPRALCVGRDAHLAQPQLVRRRPADR
jgi:xylulokinase